MSADIGLKIKQTKKGIKLSEFCLSSGEQYREIKHFKSGDEALKWIEENRLGGIDYEGIWVQGFV